MFTQSDSSELVIQANTVARKARHRRVFADASALSRLGIGKLSSISQRFSNVFSGVRRAPKADAKPVNPQNRLFKSYALAVTALFVIGAFNPATSANNFNSYYQPSLEGIEDYYFGDSVLITDQDGYLSKINPQTELADRSTVSGSFVHTVQPGETISTIANEYGLKTETVLWENGLDSKAVIKPGNELMIPPVNGIRYSAQKGDNVQKVAKLFSVETGSIEKQNQLLADAALAPGQSLFIPGARPLPTVSAVRDTIPRVTSSGRIIVNSSEIGSSSTSTPGVGKIFIWPTRGKVTQGYHQGHFAIDIADVSKPPIWAAAGGTVEKVSVGTWGGGYGNHVIINHGNGFKTLYAHMETVAVTQGQEVSQGDVIGKMGRTGRVYGRTGIHLHFEVHKNGVKQNPALYF